MANKKSNVQRERKNISGKRIRSGVTRRENIKNSFMCFVLNFFFSAHVGLFCFNFVLQADRWWGNKN